MAKELPYFKFEPNQWENGNIQMLTREDKGLFIDLCSMYWSRLGDVPEKLIIQKLCAGNALALIPLYDERIIEVIEGKIFIKFLSEQLNEFDDTSKQNSKNAIEGWEKRRKQKEESERNALALIPQSESDAIREEERREEKIIIHKQVPEISEFILFAKTEKPLIDEYSVKAKYEAWVSNGWKDGNNKKIVNWKTKLRNTLPYLKENNTKKEKNEQLRQLSTIARTSNPNV